MSVRLMTNVLRVKENGQWVLDDREIARRLSYFHLLELSRVNPIRFPSIWHGRDALTEVQRYQCKRFLRSGVRHLWDERPGMNPVPGSFAINPFEHQDVPAQTSTLSLTPQPLDAEVVHECGTTEENALAATDDSETDEQRRMVEAPPGRDMYVMAPPGTGKTHVLIERLAHLINSGVCTNPSDETLVLSFTRSAVGEVRRRLSQKVESGAHPDIAYSRVLTFDSFASRFIQLDRDPATLKGKGFEQRISLFNDLIDARLPNALERLSAVRFLFVDEVQDLSGPRAQMALKVAGIVKRNGGAVCFLGDPAQAIYDFEKRGSQALPSAAFLVAIGSGEYGPQPPERFAFEQYRRFENAEMLQFVRSARKAMGEDGLHPNGVQLAKLMAGLGEAVELESLRDAGDGANRAILARTNLEAYQIWRECEKLGIRAELWRGQSGNYWPGWIARLVVGFTQDVMPLSMAKSRWDKHIAAIARTNFEDAVDRLTSEWIIENGVIDLIKLNRLVASGSPMAQRKPDAGLVISTIHRSKGLEFDEVYLYEPRNNFAEDPEEVRVVYVASTRARRQLRVLRTRAGVVRRGAKDGSSYGLKTQHFHVKRFIPPDVMGLLVDEADALDLGLLAEEEEPDAVRARLEMIWRRGGEGIARDIVLCPDDEGAVEMSLEGTTLGSTSRSISADIQALSRWTGRKFEKGVGLQLVDVATHALDLDDPRNREHLGTACLAASPVISGICAVRMVG